AYAPEVAETEVPDPYYVGGSDVVSDLVDAGCRGLLTAVEAELAHA
ncbi:MAG: low molecular weight phosphotyrosine protein phosphatase, partial [Thermoleophilia bacterium]|nr:low molecular weight phosphotyrosine protein phosphatase [Thermoleophilia bacterium]